MGEVTTGLRAAVLAAAFRELAPRARKDAAAGSGAVRVGTVTDSACGEELDVYRTPNGSVLVFGNVETALGFGPGEAEKLRGLLDRCAMPGQEARP